MLLCMCCVAGLLVAGCAGTASTASNAGNASDAGKVGDAGDTGGAGWAAPSTSSPGTSLSPVGPSGSAASATRGPPDPELRPRGGAASTSAALRVLRAWDERRAAAFASADPVALRRLYVAGAEAGRADVSVLRAYDRRGLRVEELRTQLLAVQVLDRGPGRWRLRVTDRVAGGVAVRDGVRLALPRDRATTRVITLRRTDRGWQVAKVSTAAGLPVRW